MTVGTKDATELSDDGPNQDSQPAHEEEEEDQ